MLVGKGHKKGNGNLGDGLVAVGFGKGTMLKESGTRAGAGRMDPGILPPFTGNAME